MLEIRDLHVQFHGADHEAVRGIDLTVRSWAWWVNPAAAKPSRP